MPGPAPHPPHPATVVQPRPAFPAAPRPRPPHPATTQGPRPPPRSPEEGPGAETAQPFWWGVGAAATLIGAYLLWPSADLSWDGFVEDPGGFLGALDLVPSQAFATPPLPARRGSARIPVVREHPYQTTRICLRREDAPRRYIIVVDHHGSGRSLPAVYLPWAANEAHVMTLRATADVFLTDRLNGCGMIFAGPRATPTVVHANYYTGPDDLDARYRAGHDDLQQQARVNTLREMEYTSIARALGFGVHHSLFSPRAYFAQGQPARVFGVRRRIGWTFYAITRSPAMVLSTAQIWP
jgi:hypothetical protein